VPNKGILRGQSAILQALYMWITSYGDEDGICFPSRALLAKNIGVTVKTIDKYMEDLISLGLITKTQKKNKANNIVNVYQIMIREGVANVVPQGNSSTGVANVVPGGQGTYYPGGSGTGGTITNTILTQSSELNNNILPKPPTIDQEINKTIELFSILNKDWPTFYTPGPQRSSVKKLIKFVLEDGVDLKTLIQMAKDFHGVEYAPQIFTPSDMVSQYSKLLAKSKHLPKSSLHTDVPYKRGKYVHDKGVEI